MYKGLAFTAYEVSDLDKAREFYEGTMGLHSTGSYAGTWEEYDVNGDTFAVWKESDMTPDFYKNTRPNSALALEVEDLDALSQTLKGKGVSFLEDVETHGGHCKSAYLKDPDGNLITLHQLLE